MEIDDRLLEQCKKEIEDQLGWGGNELWTHQDFEQLSTSIEETTGVRLSAATLKRIWGKVKYNSKPTITTLDALARFINQGNWREFVREHTTNGKTSPSTTTSTQKQTEGKSTKWTVWYWALPLIFIGISFSFLFVHQQPSVESEELASNDQFSFESRRVVSVGVPNSVIFSYDASHARETDSLFIQQSWDERLRQSLRKEEYTASSIYYYPGFFLAKLVVNDRIVQEDSVYIRTDGWLSLVVQPKVPVYYKPEDVIHDGVIHLTLDKMREHSIALQPETPWVEYYNVRDFGGLTCDNFILETELKNDYSEGSGICQNTEIHIRLAGGVFILPLSIKGCVSNLHVMDADGVREGVPELGCDLSQWVKVRYEVINKKGRISINGQPALDLNLDVGPKELKGLLFRFQGTGSVNYVRLSSADGRVVYEDNFD